MRNEDPSPDDIARFDHDTAFCPDCGEEVWDEAEVCPHCHAYIGGQATRQKPFQRWMDQRSLIAVVLMLVIAFLLIWLWSVPAGH